MLPLIDNKGLKELFTVMLRLQPIYGNILELHVCGNGNLSILVTIEEINKEVESIQ